MKFNTCAHKKRIFILASQISLHVSLCRQIFEWVQGRYSANYIKTESFNENFNHTTDINDWPKFVLITYFRPTQYKVPLRMVEYCLEVLMSCLTALRGSITTGWILSQGSAQMLQDSQMMRNTRRIITRVLCFHLLIKRCVLIATLYHFLFMGLLTVVISQFV